MRYRVLYHIGESISFKTKAAAGNLSIENGHLLIRGSREVSIPIEAVRDVELFRMHGTGRMPKIDFGNDPLFVTVIRFNVFGLFAVVNFFGTGRLQKELEAAMREHGACVNVNPPKIPDTPSESI